ncbi:hypothetical protein RFI36_04675 [Acinetobacter gerneri]|uniref:Phage tail protein n=1 Tax=Acinetobacter gerneri TaxID=202952 RepID=A0AAW8JI39_9GAMM|nr:hypothetical protein [Acinetobacter gerneri]MDQ9009036.1 hypothetical protein [Acinetobacter gerneri]MDQ9013140.1 hypothetical protein [Acinetobacter gerneri]MDQ9024577.1 hypothetical protein [Acinetobacter gerneri]MDQ9051812.1 hypothetical protein [Acinetobacter gerneri]MDQ9059207.1 hypothetical protein [Acinetobacter gerneri]
MAQYLFGAGKIFATPIQDVYGKPVDNASPVEVGVLQSTSVDISYDLKELHGRGQFAVDAARGKGSIKCKATMGRINGALLNSIFFGGVVADGGIDVVTQTINGEVVPAGGKVTPIVPNAGTFIKNLGVTNSKAVALTRVSGVPETGQYSVDAAGVYTFATADVGKTVFISFKYSATVAGAKSGLVSNLDMGYTPEFAVDLFREYKGKFFGIEFFRCVSNKLAFSSKLDDYDLPEFEFQPMADDLNRVYKWTTSE